MRYVLLIYQAAPPFHPRRNGQRSERREEFQRLRAAARRGEGAALSFRSTTAFFGLLALGDMPLALDAILGLAPALGRTHWRLLTNCGAA